MKIFFLTGLMVLSACSFKKNPLTNQKDKGHEELYSEPSKVKDSDSDDVKRIVIAATNDVQARFRPRTLKFEDDLQKGTQTIQVGGADAMSAYFGILRDQYKNVVLLDSGNLFSAKTNIKEVQEFYQKNGYDALTIGLNDFNLKLPHGITSSTHLFKEYSKSAKVPLLLSNLYELKTGRGVEWKGTLPHLMKEVGGVKVGIIGLIPDDIVSLTPVNNRIGLFVEDMLTNTLRQARLLRSLGADIIVVLTHQGLHCGREMAQDAKLPLQKVNFEPRKSKVCELDNAFGTYLERLPPHLVDVVLGGRTNEKMANYVNQNIVLSGFEHGKSMSYVEFHVDVKNKKVLKDRTVVHQPVMFCREFFKETNDCFTQDPSVNHKARVPAKFLGKEILLDGPDDHASSQSTPREVEVGRALSELEADIAFIPPTSQESQLIRLSLKGGELISLLEEDFNGHSAKNWYPSPFTKDNEFLNLSLKGDPIDPAKEYFVLADLESVQDVKRLRKSMARSVSKTLPGYSWSSYEAKDSVSTAMAQRQKDLDPSH